MFAAPLRQDLETAASAVRNLNNHDFHGRSLRVDSAGDDGKQRNESPSGLDMTMQMVA
jgi:RNA recognition motif-containing protein